MKVMRAVLFGAACFLLLGLSPVPKPTLKVPEGIVHELADAGVRAFQTNLEEFYCLLGYRAGDDFVVTHGVKPTQSAGYAFLPGSNDIVVWFVDHGECPEGTIADMHTHPGFSPFEAWKPSPQDRKVWDSYPHDIHIISFITSGLNVGLMVWERKKPGLYITWENGRLVPY